MLKLKCIHKPICIINISYHILCPKVAGFFKNVLKRQKKSIIRKKDEEGESVQNIDRTRKLGGLHSAQISLPPGHLSFIIQIKDTLLVELQFKVKRMDEAEEELQNIVVELKVAESEKYYQNNELEKRKAEKENLLCQVTSFKYQPLLS